MQYKIISITLLSIIIGFIFVLLDVFRLLEYKEGDDEIYYSDYIKLRIAIDAYFKRFLVLFSFLLLVVYKLILQYIFSIIIENQIYNALLVTSIIMIGIYSYFVIFDVEID